ncbi:precorrin-3B synthase [Xinfangfangia sp. D13-10-4-6]|nr:precorrin-3B synthase [Pseudogemmobacter hezensis]
MAAGAGQVKGWCPGALRPMLSGDGLVLRVRPHAGRLTADQAQALADLAQRYGNGLIDLGSRAHLQLRGVTEAVLPALHQALQELGLLDPDPESEARRNILTTPLWRADDPTLDLVAGLETALARAPALPAKFGFAVDTAAAAAVLGGASGDIRIERAENGLILRAEGTRLGQPVTLEDAIPEAMRLLAWFLAQGAATRMARLLAQGVAPPLNATTPPLTAPALCLGPVATGLCLALPFGQMQAETLAALAVAPLRLTPWRSVVLEGVTDFPDLPGVIRDPDAALLRVEACTGAPGCTSAEAATRDLARSLTQDLADELPRLQGAGCQLHVSGCSKGCAHPGPARLTLTARAGRFDLIENGPANGTALYRGLTQPDLIAVLRGRLAQPN